LIILRHALPFFIRQTQTILRRGISLRRRETIPLYSLLIILRHAFPLCIYRTQPPLRPLVSLRGKLAKEFYCLNIVAALVRSASVIKRFGCGKTSGTEKIKEGEQKQFVFYGDSHAVTDCGLRARLLHQCAVDRLLKKTHRKERARETCSCSSSGHEPR